MQIKIILLPTCLMA
uniref:Uncharacterized protein n=1 Tax=Anguilla anguilla TaxID=7936 RepID=A0A0E9TPG5_ANGAN